MDLITAKTLVWKYVDIESIMIVAVAVAIISSRKGEETENRELTPSC